MIGKVLSTKRTRRAKRIWRLSRLSCTTLSHVPSNSELDRILTDLVARVARLNPATAGLIRAEIQSQCLNGWTERRKAHALICLGEAFRASGKLGRLRATLLVGVLHLGSGFVTQFERSGLLLTDDQALKKFGRFLTDLGVELAASGDPEWGELSERLRSYRAYHKLVLAIADGDGKLLRLLQARTRPIIKDIFAITNLAFLRHYFGVDVPVHLGEALDQLGAPEQISSAASALVALANHQRPLDALDVGAPMTGDLSNPDLWMLMRFGRILVERHAIAKQISLFGYCLERRDGTSTTVYYVRPPFAEFEYAVRLGYIRAQIGQGGWLEISKQDAVPPLSLANAAELFLRRWRKPIAELRDAGTSFRRVRLVFPIIPELYRLVGELRVFDDVTMSEGLAEDFLLPVREASDEPLRITSTMTLDEFWRIWRIMQFFCCVDVAAIRSYSLSDPTVFFNSLVRIAKEEETIEMITAVGVDVAKAREFLQLVSASVNRLGYYDLQYRPLLQIAQVNVPEHTFPSEMLHLTAIVATSNVLRNVQVANKVRLAGAPHIFVDVVASLLRSHFKNVSINRRVQSPEGNTDIDIVVLEGRRLYLFECKHSVFPTEPHEMRDVWEDIEKGVRQLQTATTVLSNPQRLQSYLAGWFPGRKSRDGLHLEIVRCVVSSHRIFSGLEREGVSIRDYSSLARLAEGGVISIGTAEGTLDTLVRGFRLTSEDGFSVADLDDYLSPKSRYFKVFAPFMHPISDPVRHGALTIARETYVFEGAADELLAHMEAIGCKRVPDERRMLRVPTPLEDLLAEIPER